MKPITTRTLFIAVFVFTLISGCSENFDTNLSEAKLIELALEKHRSKFKDPESSEFQNVKVGFRDEENIVVCGESKGKNGFGGYNAFENFIAVYAGDLKLSENKNVESGDFFTLKKSWVKTDDEMTQTFDDIWKNRCTG